MATRALAAAAAATVAGRRAPHRGGLAVLSSSASGCCCRRGGGATAHSFSFSHTSSSTAEREGEDHAEITAAQVEAALNRKNVEVVEGDRSATLLPGDAAEALRGVGAEAAGAHDAWVPDQETGVFVPADGDWNGNGDGHRTVSAPPSSVLDQAVFVRDEEMEDVERPAIGDHNNVAGAGAK